MARFIEEIHVSKIAKALIANRGKLWVLICHELKEAIRYSVLENDFDTNSLIGINLIPFLFFRHKLSHCLCLSERKDFIRFAAVYGYHSVGGMFGDDESLSSHFVAANKNLYKSTSLEFSCFTVSGFAEATPVCCDTPQA